MSKSNSEENKRSAHQDFKSLLDQLQMESWQLELIISGVALFAVWELRTVIGSLSEFQDVYGRSTSTTNIIVAVFGIGMSISWIVLFINLIIHIFSRGLWIGMIGLRYVSHDIEYENLNYAPKFENFLRKKIIYLNALQVYYLPIPFFLFFY